MTFKERKLKSSRSGELNVEQCYIGRELVTVSIRQGQVLAASAVNSAVLLLRSACDKTPRGVANSSGLVGRNYMAHNNMALMSVGWAINKRSADHFTSALSIRQGQVLSGALSKL